MQSLNIQTDYQFQTSQHDVFIIYYKTQTDKNYILSTQDSSILMQYSYMNTSNGGDEVYIARNLLGLYIINQPSLSKNARLANTKTIDSGKKLINNINIFPNPTNNILYIDLNKEQTVNIIIYDLIGKEVLNSVLSGKNLSFNLNSLNKGTYIIRLYENSNPIFTEKVLKL